MAATATARKTVDIRRNDTVKVLSGKDKGKQGRVLRVFPDVGRVLVEHVAVVKKTVSTKSNPRTKGGIADQESPISISKVQLVCSTCGPIRVGHEVRGDRKVRVCRKCGTTLDKT
jgi:large subunit ribosomal protein L24